MDTSVQLNGAILSSNASGGVTYQWLDCNNGNTSIAGATSQSYTPLVNGSYKVVVNNVNCSDTSACHIFNGIGIAAVALSNSIYLFPNPSGGKTTIDLSKVLHNASLRLLDIMGQTVYETMGLSGNSFFLDISTYSKAIYFIELSDQQNVLRAKLVKE